jgi:hypothetical protein
VTGTVVEEEVDECVRVLPPLHLHDRLRPVFFTVPVGDLLGSKRRVLPAPLLMRAAFMERSSVTAVGDSILRQAVVPMKPSPIQKEA